MKIIFILPLLLLYFSSYAETQIFKVGYIDLKDDIRYSDWGRHPVDIRSSHRNEQRAIDGAKLGVIDSKKFERITKTQIVLDHLRYSDEKKLLNFFKSDVINEYNAVLLDLNLQILQNLQSSINIKNQVIFFNISNPNNLLRTDRCIDNLYHTFPSNMMKTDALAQFLVQKKWNKTLLLTGSLKEDKNSSKSFKVSSKKFGVKIVEEKNFVNSNDPRVREKNDLSFLTQGRKFKSIFISDIDGEFALGVPYSTMTPVAVVGSSGLSPKAWHWSYMRHGAPQVNGRFERSFNRRMNEKDWASWIAIKSILESILRIKSTDTNKIKNFLVSNEFKVDGSKGISLNYRKKTKQLRQTMLLVSSNNWVTEVAPIESFKNSKNNLDTLGIIQKEIECNINNYEN